MSQSTDFEAPPLERMCTPDGESSGEGSVTALIGEESQKFLQPRLKILKVIMYPTGAVLVICSASPAFASTWVIAELKGMSPDGAAAMGLINVAGKNALLCVFLFPTLKSIAEFLSRKYPSKTSGREKGKVILIYAAGIPSSLMFALYNLGTFDDFHASVVNNNSTITNITLSPTIVALADWVETPVPRVLAAGSAGIVNFFSNPTVFFIFLALMPELWKECRALSEKSSAEKIKFYIKMLGGAAPFVVVSEWGVVPYIFITEKLFRTYLYFPSGLGFTLGAAQLAFMSLLVTDTAYPLGKNIALAITEMVRREFEYPETAQLVINISKGVVTIGIVALGSLHMVWANNYAGIGSTATDVATAVASVAFETMGVYTGLSFLEVGVRWLGNKLIESCCRREVIPQSVDLSVDGERSVEDNTPPPQTWKAWGREKMSFWMPCCFSGNRGKVPHHDIPEVISNSGVSLEFTQ